MTFASDNEHFYPGIKMNYTSTNEETLLLVMTTDEKKCAEKGQKREISNWKSRKASDTISYSTDAFAHRRISYCIRALPRLIPLVSPDVPINGVFRSFLPHYLIPRLKMNSKPFHGSAHSVSDKGMLLDLVQSLNNPLSHVEYSVVLQAATNQATN